MKDKKRKEIVERVLSSAPRDTKLRAATKRNLEHLDDESLNALAGRTKRLRQYAQSIPKPEDGSQTKSELLAQRRQALYRKLAAIQPKNGRSAPAAPTSVTAIVQQGSTALSTQIKPHQDIDLVATLDAVTAVARQIDTQISDTLRLTTVKYLQNFSNMATPDLHIQVTDLENLMTGPIKMDLDHYLRLSFEKISRDILRIVRNRMFHGSDPSRFKDDHYATLLLMAERTSAFEIDLLANSKNALPKLDVVDALAKMRIFTRNYSPDAVVSASNDGRMIADFVATEARLSRESVFVMECKTNKVTRKGSWASFKGRRRILLVNDLADDNATLSMARDSLWEKYGDVEIHVMALAGSYDAYQKIVNRESSGVLIPKLFPDANVHLPWGRNGIYNSRPRSHVFGAGSEQSFTITRIEMDQAASDIEQNAQIDALA